MYRLLAINSTVNIKLLFISMQCESRLEHSVNNICMNSVAVSKIQYTLCGVEYTRLNGIMCALPVMSLWSIIC